jgi:hypothetical protein
MILKSLIQCHLSQVAGVIQRKSLAFGDDFQQLIRPKIAWLSEIEMSGTCRFSN